MNHIQGTKVEFNHDSKVMTGKIVGLALPEQPLIGCAYIIEPDRSIRNEVYDYTHIMLREIDFKLVIDTNKPDAVMPDIKKYGNDMERYMLDNNVDPKLDMFIKDNLLGLIESNLDLVEYPNKTFYSKNGKCHFEYLIDMDFVLIDHDLIWTPLRKDFNFSIEQVRNLVKFIVETNYGLKKFRVDSKFIN